MIALIYLISYSHQSQSIHWKIIIIVSTQERISSNYCYNNLFRVMIEGNLRKVVILVTKYLSNFAQGKVYCAALSLVHFSSLNFCSSSNANFTSVSLSDSGRRLLQVNFLLSVLISPIDSNSQANPIK